MRRSTSLADDQRERMLVRGRAAVQVIVLACIAAACLALAARQANGAEVARAGPAVEIVCDRDAGSTARSLPPSSDGRVCGAVPIWKTIILGTHDSVASLREAVRRYTGKLAGEGLDGPTFNINKTWTDVDLTVLSVAELGFEGESAPLVEVYARALELGLEPCPAEVALQLRLQYADQPVGEFLHIAMKPLATERGDLVGLSVANGGAGLLLIGSDGRPDLTVPSTVRFVFVRPR
jgi:hypothetical protein